MQVNLSREISRFVRMVQARDPQVYVRTLEPELSEGMTFTRPIIGPGVHILTLRVKMSKEEFPRHYALIQDNLGYYNIPVKGGK